MPHVRSAFAISALLTLAALSACRKPDKTGEGQPGPYADMVDRAVPRIELSTGLKFKTPPKVETRTQAQVRDFVLAAFQDSTTQHELAGTDAAYKLLGMLPDTLDIKKMMVNLLTEQVVGLYDPKTKVLYIVEGAKRDMVLMTVSHELVHALQDQYVNLDSVQQSSGDNDRKSAAQAVFEGQALYEQFAANGVSLDMMSDWNRIRQFVRDNQKAMPVFASAPYLVQETLLFPYLNGAEFIKSYKMARGNVVPFSDMPTSTEQILHPDAYLTVRDQPTPVSFATIRHVTPWYNNNLGEFETRLMLVGRLRTEDAEHAADGWDGDRYIVFKTPKGEGIAWASVWDSDNQAQRFRAMLDRVVAARNADTMSTSARARKITAGKVDGRPVVLYVDVPQGVDPALVPISSVRLGQ